MSEPDEVQVDIGALYRSYAPMVLRRVRQFVGAGDAEEATHEVFLRALERVESFRAESSPATWLYRLATNYCINRIRDQKRRRELLAEHGPMVFGRPERAANQEASVFLSQLWRTLDSELALIGTLYYVDGMTTQEIGRVVGCSDRTVANRLKTLAAKARQAAGAPS